MRAVVLSLPDARAFRVAFSALSLAILGACAGSDAVAPIETDAMIEKKTKSGGTTTPTSPTSPTPVAGNALAGMSLYVSPTSRAARQADAWQATRPADAEYMRRLAAHPVGHWFNGWSSDVTAAVNAAVTAAAAEGRTAVLVAYNIPYRDCGSYSAGGLKASEYGSWIRAFAAGIAGRRAIVVLEPDAIAGASCLSDSLQDERFALLRDAVGVLSSSGAFVYLDAGHPRWLSFDTAVARLTKAGIAQAQGFALNVSNFVSTGENVSYGDELSRRLGGKRYVIDTSRNGLGPAANNAWCNPEGRAIGNVPTTQPGYAIVDALLWVKVPGESDGACNGGPSAGAWWPEYALGLAQRSSYLP